jgi:hypothetical protein
MKTEICKAKCEMWHNFLGNENSGAARTLAATERRHIYATLGDKQEARAYSSMVNFNGDGCIWNRRNLGRAAMDRTIIPYVDSTDRCKSKKYYHLDKQHKPNRTITKTEKSTAQIFYQLKVGHALIGPHLKRIKKAEDDKCWWCTREVAQSREHLCKHCKHLSDSSDFLSC